MLAGSGASTTFAGSISCVSLRPGSATRQVKNFGGQVWIFSHTIRTSCLLGNQTQGIFTAQLKESAFSGRSRQNLRPDPNFFGFLL